MPSGIIPAASKALVSVRKSRVHGNGVFAVRKIAAGTQIIEYAGERVSARKAAQRSGQDPDNPFHTFFFSLESGKLIDGASQGNDARWINHCCEPNCEAREEDGKIFIYALTDIKRGQELNYDYGLVVEERHTAAVRRSYACHCGASACRKTMLAPRKKSKKSGASA